MFEAEGQNRIEINFLQNSLGHKPDVLKPESKQEEKMKMTWSVWLIKRLSQ